MTVDELKATAKEMGYKLMPIAPYVKLKACICGCKRREHWSNCETAILRCMRCGREVVGHDEVEARRNWNRMIEEERSR